MMKNQINIADLLKDCPKGTKLYSPLCGECEFDRLNFGTIICKKQNTQEITFTSKGYYMLPVFDDCECIIFPSKNQRDWSKFVPPCEFKDGDVLVHTQNGRFIMSIYKSNENEKLINTHVIFWDREEGLSVGMQICCYTDNVRFATEEEKAKLFDAIKAEGYKWNANTNTLEKLPETKFKVGDRIKNKNVNLYHTVNSILGGSYIVDDNLVLDMKMEHLYELAPDIKPKFKIGDRIKKDKDYISGIVTDIFDDSFKVTYDGGGCSYVQFHYQDAWELVPDIKPKFKVGDRIRSIISNSGYIYNVIEVKESLYVVSKNNEYDNKLIDFKIQDYWELVPNKFDISTLKPFESRVLVRHNIDNKWCGSFFSHIDDDFHSHCYKYVTIAGKSYPMCIPYEGNEHLRGTTDDCEEYFKTW